MDDQDFLEDQLIDVRDGNMNIRSALKGFEHHYGIRAFSLEFELIMELFNNGPTSAGELVKGIKASQASFYSISKNLKQRGIIVSRQGDVDRREVIYALSEESSRILSLCHTVSR